MWSRAVSVSVSKSSYKTVLSRKPLNIQELLPMKLLVNTLLSIWIVLSILAASSSSTENVPRIIRDYKTRRQMSVAMLDYSRGTPAHSQRSSAGDPARDEKDSDVFGGSKHGGFEMIMRDGTTASLDSTGSPEIAWNFLLKMMGLQGVGVQNLKETLEVGVEPSRTLDHSLYCRNGLFLEILNNGTVRGTLKTKVNVNMHLKFHLLGPQIVQIQGKESKLYVAIDKQGKVYGSKQRSVETVFYFSNNDQYFLHFQSLYYRMLHDKNHWYLGLKRNGHPKKASTSRSTSNNAQFLTQDVLQHPAGFV